jgi:hypothetical protein
MCISNIGNRRAFPTNGFKSRGHNVSAAVMLKNAAPKDSSKQQESNDNNDDNSHNINPHIIVQHDYHDHAKDSRLDYQEDAPARGGVTTPFPLKLHDMLEEVISNGHEHIVSWQPHGRCFVVHKPKEFVGLLPHYFKLSKLASFQRQLNLYGFQRLTRGRDRGGYYHELFLKNRVFLAHSIQRIKVKGTGVRARSNPDEEPDFWSMPWVEGNGSNHVVDSSSTASTSSTTSTDACSLPVSSSSSSLPQHLMLSKPSSSNDAIMFNNTGLPASFFEQSFPLNFEPNMILPQQQPTHQQQLLEDDIFLDGFGNKHFHFVLQQQEEEDSSSSQQQPVELQDSLLLSNEVDAFFEDFDFPDDIGNEIEDDQVFGDLLEQMCA